MNKTGIVVGGIVIAVIVVGLIIYNLGSTPASQTATTTPTGTATTTQVGETRTPSAPTVVTNSAASPFDTAVVVSGTVTPNGAFTNYWYEYGTTESLGSKTANQNVGSGYVPFSAPIFITGLTKNTTYFFRLAAENQFGKVVGNQYTFQTTSGTPAPVGAVPTVKTIAASGITRVAANLQATIVPNKASTTYWFEYGKTQSLGSITSFQSVGDGSVSVPASASLPSLDPSTNYFFRIDAQNQFGTVNGSILTFKTLGPVSAAPSVETKNVSAVATSTATMHGSVNPNGEETTYWFEYSTNSLLGSIVPQSTTHTSAGATSSVVAVTSDISVLTSKTTYNYRLVAQNSAGITKGASASFKTK